MLPFTRHSLIPPPNSFLYRGLAAVGAIYTTRLLFHLSSFAYLQYLRPSRLHSYTKAPDGNPAWALITGSSDGLGLGFATELLAGGFNVILHGRNLAKLERVRASLLASYPAQQIEIISLDAGSDADEQTKFSALSSRLADKHLTILVNNVGGHAGPGPLCSPHASRLPGHDRNAINVNICFALEITRVVLPFLTGHGQPACVLNVGSASGRLPSPYIAVAGATKAFMESWSKSLAAEMTAEGHDQIDVRCELVGMCSTGGAKRPVTWLVPDARTYAKKSLSLVGAERRVVWGYWPHALQFAGIFPLPLWIKERAVTKVVREQIMAEDQASRQEVAEAHK
ncbi:uncharacterized protein HMPREF1541_03037 [Cyphellophora europaea CBS 101466]|uniref:Very-long-chain 3-oxoacyl-CoA reductase n=1 Tax=Cyphellophora europaea (strain CBS 101466) TaxID=1220924 RepID=W2RXC7_CYPE1|nr:uncharacterized protein HMPREF1541_03037 [Cyphellophora europaea CBS 101466]ETN41102.1 hypothetical protein HMPREF1541_03037 [Cyphellophora europaea CBS 101466]